MAGTAAEVEETLTNALSLLVNLGKVILQNAKQEAGASLEQFVPNKITTMFGLMTAAADFYNRIGVTKKSDAESAWAKSYHQAAVREGVENLLQLENEWDSFVASVDEGLRPAETQGPEGSTADRLSGDLALVDARTAEAVTLGQYLAELEANQALLGARSAQVLFVSYGSVEGARLWLEQTGCTFPMLLDPQRTIYRAFGLGSSYAKVLKFDFLLEVSECVVAGREIPDVSNRLLGDIWQMGGDFLLDQEGKVLLSHRSQHPLDRPAMADLLAAMPGKP
ncbi:unnamed protein product [Boreogadus saida]